MNKQRFSVSLLVTLVAVTCAPAAIAQNQPLAGTVEMSVDHAIRIDRSSLRRSTGVDSSEFQTNLIPQEAQLAPLVDSRQFQGAAKQIEKPAPILNSSLMQQVASQIQAAAPLFNASATKNPADKLAPYIWYQSAMGGYYDASGTTKELVRAERLHLFGGKFEDGTIVPKSQIRDYNSMGHAFKQAKLDTNHFWNH